MIVFKNKLIKPLSEYKSGWMDYVSLMLDLVSLDFDYEFPIMLIQFGILWFITIQSLVT
jgi:hypothetical protein